MCLDQTSLTTNITQLLQCHISFESFIEGEDMQWMIYILVF